MHSSFISNSLFSITFVYIIFYFTVVMFVFAYAKKNLKNICFSLLHV